MQQVVLHKPTKELCFIGETDLNFLFSNTTLVRDSFEAGRIKNNQYGVTAGFGYFIANNVMIGVSGAYSYSYTKIEPGNLNPLVNENTISSLASCAPGKLLSST